MLCLNPAMVLLLINTFVVASSDKTLTAHIQEPTGTIRQGDSQRHESIFPLLAALEIELASFVYVCTEWPSPFWDSQPSYLVRQNNTNPTVDVMARAVMTRLLCVSLTAFALDSNNHGLLSLDVTHALYTAATHQFTYFKRRFTYVILQQLTTHIPILYAVYFIWLE